MISTPHALRPCVRSMRAFALLAIVLAASLGFAQQASAQGTMGTVPDPITSRDLDDYARRLGISAQQRAALEGYHEEYKIQFAVLRDGDIEKYLNAASGAGGGGGRGMGGRGAGMGMMFGNTDRKAIEDSLRQLQSINDRIKALDNSLFDQIQTLLTEDQIIALTSVRQARERDRYRTGLSRMATFTNPSTQVDLSQMVADLTLSPDEKANASPLLSAYETSLTTATRKLHDDAAESTVTMLEKLEKQGFTPDAMQDERRRGQMFEAFRTVWSEVMGTMNERASEISELNRKTERALTGVLAADNSRRLRDNFYRRAYPELRASSNTTRAFEVALKFEDLTEDQRTAIAAMQQQYLDGVDRLTEQMADAIDAQRKTRSGMDFGGDRGGRGGRGGGGGGGGGGNDGTGQDDEVRRLREERQQLVESMRSQMEGVLGPEKTEQLQTLVAQARDRQREEGRTVTATFVAAGPGGGTFTATTDSPIVISGVDLEGLELDIAGPSRDPFVPQAISSRDIDVYSKRLGLDEDERTILNGLHDEYADRFAVINDTDIQAVRDADESLWQRGEDGGRPTPPTTEAVDRLYTLRRQAISAINTLDEQFFNDVQVALMSDEQKPLLDRVRQARLRAIYNRGGNGQNLINIGGGVGGGQRGGRGGGGGQRMFFAGGMGGTAESSVDLSVLVEQSKVVATDPAQLDSGLAEYEAAATAAFQTMFETSMRMRQATDRMASQFTRGGGPGQGGGGGGGREAIAINGDTIRQTMETDGKAARDAGQALTTLNRETLERVLAMLDATNADLLRRSYNRKAFPSVYRDPRSAEPRIEAAMALPDLSDQQRDQLQTMAFEFHATYDALCDQMVDLERNSPAMNFTGGPGNIDIQALQERSRSREKLEFERNDLSDKMLARLRASLSEEQIARLGLQAGAGSY